MLWVRVPPEQLFFSFSMKKVVQVSCIALFIYVSLRVFMQILNLGLGHQSWFKYPSQVFDVEIESICLSG